jgi:hypothetical protein
VVISRKPLDLPPAVARRFADDMPVPELTRGAGIKLNRRVSLRRHFRGLLMENEKRQLAKLEKITKAFRKTSGELCARYAEVLRLRDEIARLAASGTKVGQSRRS